MTTSLDTCYVDRGNGAAQAPTPWFPGGIFYAPGIASTTAKGVSCGVRSPRFTTNL